MSTHNATKTHANSLAGKWGYSHNEETYHGAFDTREEAIAEGAGNGTIYVGQYREPTPPEEYVDANLILEHVQCQDEYSGEWAEDFLDVDGALRDELTDELRRVFAAWLDKHELRPRFGIIDTAEEIDLESAAQHDAANS